MEERNPMILYFIIYRLVSNHSPIYVPHDMETKCPMILYSIIYRLVSDRLLCYYFYLYHMLFHYTLRINENV